MKVVGRQVLTQADVDAGAKKRLALWVKELAEARWTTVDEMRASFPEMLESGENRFSFPFIKSGIKVEALACLDLGIVCVERVLGTESAEE